MITTGARTTRLTFKLRLMRSLRGAIYTSPRDCSISGLSPQASGLRADRDQGLLGARDQGSGIRDRGPRTRDQGIAPGAEQPWALSPGACCLRCGVGNEGDAAIQLASLFARVVVFGAFLSKTDCLQALDRYALADQILLPGVGASIVERELVLGRSEATRVAFDAQPQQGIALQHVRRFVEFPRLVQRDVESIAGELNVFERVFLLRKLSLRRLGVRARR